MRARLAQPFHGCMFADAGPDVGHAWSAVVSIQTLHRRCVLARRHLEAQAGRCKHASRESMLSNDDIWMAL